MQKRDLFFAKATLPENNMPVSRIFAVKEVAEDGSIEAFILSRISADEIEEDIRYTVVARSRENLFKVDTPIDVSVEFQFPANWKMNLCHGKLSQESYDAMVAQQARYIEKNGLVQHEVREVDASVQKDALREMVENIKEQYRQDPERIAEYIAFRSRFYNYSVRNCLLMAMQNPYAQFVASYTRFKQMGYMLRPEEYTKPMQILAGATTEYVKVEGRLVDIKKAPPEIQIAVHKGDLETIKRTNFFPAYVYDISQTNCPREDIPKLFNMGRQGVEHAAFYETMKRISIDAGVPVKEESLRSIALHGYYDRKAKDITINALLGGTAKATVMAHEFSHALLHQTSTDTKAVKEFEAQALALTVMYKYGLPVDQSEHGYLADYFKAAEKEAQEKGTSFDLELSLNRIAKQAAFIDEKLEERQLYAERDVLRETEIRREAAPRAQEAMKKEVSAADILENFMIDL